MLFTARIEAQIKKTHGKPVEIESETRADAQDIAEDLTTEPSNEEVETEWDLMQDSGSMTELIARTPSILS